METHYIRHNYKEELILPIAAFIDNMKFLLDELPMKVVTADGVFCEVIEYKWSNILDLEDKIREIYDIDAYSFIKKWYISTGNRLTSLECVLMKVKRIE